MGALLKPAVTSLACVKAGSGANPSSREGTWTSSRAQRGSLLELLLRSSTCITWPAGWDEQQRNGLTAWIEALIYVNPSQKEPVGVGVCVGSWF